MWTLEAPASSLRPDSARNDSSSIFAARAPAKVSWAPRRRPLTTRLGELPRPPGGWSLSSERWGPGEVEREDNADEALQRHFHTNRVTTCFGSGSTLRQATSRQAQKCRPRSSDLPAAAGAGSAPAAQVEDRGKSLAGSAGSRSRTAMVPRTLVSPKADRSTGYACPGLATATGPTVRDRALTVALGVARPPPFWVGRLSGRSVAQPRNV